MIRSVIAVAALVASVTVDANYEHWENAGACYHLLISVGKGGDAKAMQNDIFQKFEEMDSTASTVPVMSYKQGTDRFFVLIGDMLEEAGLDATQRWAGDLIAQLDCFQYVPE